MKIGMEGGKPFGQTGYTATYAKASSRHPCHTQETLVLTKRPVKGAQSSKKRLESFVKRSDGQCPMQMLSFLLQKITCSVGRAVLHLSLCRGGASWGEEWLGLLE